jgi:thioredoxin 2
VTLVACPSCSTRNRLRPNPRGTPRCARCSAPLPWIVEASEETFAAEADAPVPVLVDLWAPWCGPCRAVAPVLERLARRHARRLKVVKVNVDEAPGLARRFDARSIPTLVVLEGGRPVERIIGALPEAQLEARLTPHLSRAA